ncbi:TetR/AcrR family transcriptional regulator [Corynebacterium diphtheriae]
MKSTQQEGDMSQPESPEQRRTAILATAERILRSGSPLTLGKVAQEVGISRTALYRYVSGIDEIIETLATKDFPHWLTSLRSAMAAAPTPKQRALCWAIESIKLGRETDHAWLATLSSLNLSENCRNAIASEHSKIDQLLRVELAQLGTPHIELTVATVRTVVMTAIQTPSSTEADDYFTATISAIIDASC